jgi:hypothetical protein
MNHICDKLPDMKARFNTLVIQAQHELNLFGDEAIYSVNCRYTTRPLKYGYGSGGCGCGCGVVEPDPYHTRAEPYLSQTAR